MFGTVVIPLDGSLLANHALPFARRVARDWGGRLILVRAEQERANSATSSIQGDLETLAGELAKKGISAVARVIHEPPAKGIARVAEEVDAELIVMASHQRHGLDRWFAGSVTEAVLRRSPVPLLVIPLDGARVPSREAPVRILVPLDASEEGEAALERVAEIAAGHPLRVLLLRVITPVTGVAILGGFYAPLPQEDLNAAQEYLRTREEQLRRRAGSVESRIVESLGPVAPAVIEVAQAEHVDAIAMATHGRGALASLALGSVAVEVLETTPVPLLLVHRQSARQFQATPAKKARPRAPFFGTGAAMGSSR